MWPTVWWPQALMQPEILILSAPMSCSRFSASNRLAISLRSRGMFASFSVLIAVAIDAFAGAVQLRLGRAAGSH